MSAWTHLICPACWVKRHPGRVPVKVREDARPLSYCCFCGTGCRQEIYVREDPKELLCRGDGPEHA